MDPGIVAALVGAAASLTVAVGSLLRSRTTEKKAAESAKDLAKLQNDFSHGQEIARRRLDADDVISRYRWPLATAAFDLQARLGNILDNRFLAYVGVPGRGEQAVTSTLFRVAQYFGWAEAVRQGIQFLDLNDPEHSREVSDQIRHVSRHWATDQQFGTDDPGRELMIWVEAQRAIGELMLVEQGESFSIMGFARFSAEVESIRTVVG